MAQAVLPERQPRGVKLVADAVVDQGRAGRDRHVVQQLERLLHLEGRHHRRDRGRGGHLARQDLVTLQERATVAEVQQLVITLGHRAFVTRRVGAERRP